MRWLEETGPRKLMCKMRQKIYRYWPPEAEKEEVPSRGSGLKEGGGGQEGGKW